MKILQIITLSELGGAQSVVLELSNSLVEKGFEVVVMSNPGGDMWNLLDKRVEKEICLSFKREISPINELKALFKIKKVIRRTKPDVIHLHSSKIGVLGRVAAFPFKTKKVIYTVHGFDTILKANRVFLPLEKLLKRCCKKIVAVSKYDKNNLQENGIRNVAVVYNGLRDFSGVADEEALLFIKNLKIQGKRLILNISRLASPKRFDLYKEMAIKQESSENVFIWIGNKEEVVDLPSNLFCLGEIPNARGLIPYVDYFMLISDYEGLPMAIIEAMSAGIPVIASSVGGIPELFDGGAGFSVPNDSNLLIEKLVFLQNNSDLYDSVSKKARMKYEKDFTIDKMVESYLKIYRSNI
ncbi:MAG: glycosyltransferase [Spirochaetales bacterium]|nr:glycosyltransferase [Spirochaetales bacterium]